MKVLVIEDDVAWELKIEMILSELSHVELKTARSLSDARSCLKEFLPDLILSDVILPDGLAFELFKGLKREYPIIFLTGYPQDEYLENALSLLNTAFVVKPFHRLTLLGLIQNIMPQQKDADVPKGFMVPGRFRKKFFLAFESILYIEADSNYVHIYTSERNYIIKRSLRMLMFDLDQRFVQVHKSFVVNTAYVNRLDLSAQQIIVSGKPIPVGRSFRQDVIQLFNQ